MITNAGNGWRDLTDEGPGFTTHLEKEGYSITVAQGKKLIVVSGPARKKNGDISKNINLTDLAHFASIKDARQFVDNRLELDKPESKYKELDTNKLMYDIKEMAAEIASRDSLTAELIFAHSVLAEYYKEYMNS